MTDSTPVKPMAQTERRALAKIIDARFKVLQSELDTRREQIEDATRDRLIQEAQDACAEAKRRMQPLIDRARELEDDIRTFVDECRAELGVEPGEVQTYNEFVTVSKTRRVIKTSQHKPITVSVSSAFAPLNIESRINAELRRLLTERNQGGRSLDYVRLDLHEELLLGAVQSDAAKAFLDRIPALDSILPPVAEVTHELESGDKPTKKPRRK